MGSDNLKRHMAAPLQRILCAYDVLYALDEKTGQVSKKVAVTDGDNPGPQSLEQLQKTFTADFIASLYDIFSAFCGRYCG